ncbi:hypothetical protein Tco_0485446 [Tanacetum coccineum]
MLFRGIVIQKLRQKGVYEEKLSRHACMNWGKLIHFMHTTNGPYNKDKRRSKAGLQVFKTRKLEKTLQLAVLWKTLFCLYLTGIGTLKQIPILERFNLGLPFHFVLLGVKSQPLIMFHVTSANEKSWDCQHDILLGGRVKWVLSGCREKEGKRRVNSDRDFWRENGLY